MTTYSINGTKAMIFKNADNKFEARFTEVQDDYMIESYQFEIDNFLSKSYKTAKEIKRMIDDFAMSLR
jgi:hypothetical protein